MTRGNKPFLRIQRRPDNKMWLSIQRFIDGRAKTIRSYGSANNPENWDDAIEGLLVELARHYHTMKGEHLKNITKFRVDDK